MFPVNKILGRMINYSTSLWAPVYFHECLCEFVNESMLLFELSAKLLFADFEINFQTIGWELI